MAKQDFRPVQCNRGCGQLVYFDRKSDNGWSQTGKMVPLQWENGPTDEGHQCPNSDYNRKRSGSPSTETRQQTVSASTAQHQGTLMEILGKVEKVIATQEIHGKVIHEILKAINANPSESDFNYDSRSNS